MEKSLIMIIRRKMVKNTFLLIFSDPEIVFVLYAKIMKSCFHTIFAKDYGNMGFHGNQIGDMVPNYW